MYLQVDRISDLEEHNLDQCLIYQVKNRDSAKLDNFSHHHVIQVSQFLTHGHKLKLFFHTFYILDAKGYYSVVMCKISLFIC